MRPKAPRPPIKTGTDGWLFGVEALHSPRAPGNACLSALKAAKAIGMFASNDSKGCGGVMRVSPVGLIEREPDRAFELAADLCRLTHGHVSGYLSGGYLAAVIAGLAGGRSLDQPLDGADAVLATHEGRREVAAAIAAARAAARRPASSAALEQLGQGWVAEEALAMSIYCALAHRDDLAAALMLAVNHGGDSDSTGAITGNILGTLLGAAAIPAGWLAELELRQEIERLAADLASVTRLGADYAQG